MKSDEQIAAEGRSKDAHREAADARKFDRPAHKIKDADTRVRQADADLDRVRRGR